METSQVWGEVSHTSPEENPSPRILASTLRIKSSSQLFIAVFILIMLK